MQNVAQTPATRSTDDNTGQIPMLFDASETERLPKRPAGLDYLTIQHSEEFRELRSRLRRFVFPMTALFLAWYVVFVILAGYAQGLLSIRVFGEVNIGILLGIGQFVSTAVITVAYLRFAKRRLDPQVEKVRQQAGE